MKLRKLEIENFKSFRGRHELTFDQESGLFLLTGANQVDEDLGGNGAGKSTILDALYWCLYGKTPRGLKASNVKTWGAKGPCSVKLLAEFGDQLGWVIRQHGPNLLRKAQPGNETGWDVEQSDVDKLVGLNAEAFAHAILIPQFGDQFFDLSPAAKLALFSEVLDLQSWIDKSARAAAEEREASDIVNGINRGLSGATTAEASAATHLASLQESNAQYAEAYARELKRLERERDDAASKLTLAQTTHKVAANKVETQTLDDTDTKLRALDKQRRAAEEKVNEAQIDRSRRKTLADITQKESIKVRHAMDEASTICPYCRQPVSMAHLKAEAARLTKEYEDLAYNVDHADKEVAKLKLVVVGIMDQERDLRRKAEQAKAKAQEGQLLVAKAARAQAEAERAWAQAEQALASHKQRENPYDQLIRAAKSNLKQAKLSVKQHQEDLVIAERRQKSVAYWVKGFKELRLMLIEEALTALTVEVNNNLIQLGLSGWEIRFDVERETKSGTISKGFQVLVRCPTHDGEVPFEAWSGGEGQRLRLAGTMGLANLILSRKGVVSDLEVWDEPSQHLSVEGLSDLVDALHDRAKLLGKRVWLIEHHALDYGAFDGVWAVIKDKSGSHIESRTVAGE